MTELDIDSELVQIPSSDLNLMVDAVERAQAELQTERRKRAAAEEANVKSDFKQGGYGMFNRRSRWLAVLNSSAPDWLKVVEYCACHHGKDGHCTIDGEFGPTVLGKSMKPPNVTRLVKRAVDEGMLAEGSNSRCLVAPYWSRFMTTGDVRSGCSRH